jgi:hypothetical protein
MLTGGTPKLITQGNHGVYLLAARNAEPPNARRKHSPALSLQLQRLTLQQLLLPTRPQCRLESHYLLNPLQPQPQPRALLLFHPLK